MFLNSCVIRHFDSQRLKGSSLEGPRWHILVQPALGLCNIQHVANVMLFHFHCIFPITHTHTHKEIDTHIQAHIYTYHIKEKLEKRNKRGTPKVSNLEERDEVPTVVK